MAGLAGAGAGWAGLAGGCWCGVVAGVVDVLRALAMSGATSASPPSVTHLAPRAARRRMSRRVRVLILAAGVGLLITSAETKYIWIGIAGAAMMLAAAVSLLRSNHRSPAPSTPGPPSASTRAASWPASAPSDPTSPAPTASTCTSTGSRSARAAGKAAPSRAPSSLSARPALAPHRRRPRARSRRRRGRQDAPARHHLRRRVLVLRILLRARPPGDTQLRPSVPGGSRRLARPDTHRNKKPTRNEAAQEKDTAAARAPFQPRPSR
jgi:hypothetical protein